MDLFHSRPKILNVQSGINPLFKLAISLLDDTEMHQLAPTAPTAPTTPTTPTFNYSKIFFSRIFLYFTGVFSLHQLHQLFIL